jgi:hypothetical protein
MAKYRPTTIESFRQIEGVSEASIIEYADRFMSTIAQFCKSHSLPSNTKNKRPQSSAFPVSQQPDDNDGPWMTKKRAMEPDLSSTSSNRPMPIGVAITNDPSDDDDFQPGFTNASLNINSNNNHNQVNGVPDTDDDAPPPLEPAHLLHSPTTPTSVPGPTSSSVMSSARLGRSAGLRQSTLQFNHQQGIMVSPQRASLQSTTNTVKMKGSTSPAKSPFFTNDSSNTSSSSNGHVNGAAHHGMSNLKREINAATRPGTIPSSTVSSTPVRTTSTGLAQQISSSSISASHAAPSFPAAKLKVLRSFVCGRSIREITEDHSVRRSNVIQYLADGIAIGFVIDWSKLSINDQYYNEVKGVLKRYKTPEAIPRLPFLRQSVREEVDEVHWHFVCHLFCFLNVGLSLFSLIGSININGGSIHR